MTNTGGLTSDDHDASIERDLVRPEHELWLAMRAAHAQWVDATNVVDELMTGSELDTLPSAFEIRRLAKATGDQRIAFQEYIEARLAFSEFLVSRASGAGTAESARQAAEREGASRLTGLLLSTKLALAALTVAVLCPAIYGTAYIAQARRHTRDLEAARVAMTSLLTQVQTQGSEHKADVATAVAATPAPETAMPLKAADAAPALPRKPKPTTTVAARRQAFDFTLAPSARYSKIGPVQLSLYNLDHRRNTFDVSIIAGKSRFERKHVRIREAVWINRGGSLPPIRLLADRMGRNDVHGTLSNPAVKATSATQSRFSRQQHGD